MSLGPEALVKRTGSKFKMRADAILSGTITALIAIFHQNHLRHYMRQVYMGCLHRNRSPSHCQTRRRLWKHNREEESWITVEDSRQANVGEGRRLRYQSTKVCSSIPIQFYSESSLMSAWVSWAEFAADDLDLSEVHGGARQEK